MILMCGEYPTSNQHYNPIGRVSDHGSGRYIQLNIIWPRRQSEPLIHGSLPVVKHAQRGERGNDVGPIVGLCGEGVPPQADSLEARGQGAQLVERGDVGDQVVRQGQHPQAGELLEPGELPDRVLAQVERLHIGAANLVFMVQG